MEFKTVVPQVGADGTRFVQYTEQGQVGGIYLPALLIITTDGRVLAVNPKKSAPEYTARFEDSKKDGKWSTATFRIELTGAVALVLWAYNTIGDRYGYSGLFAAQLQALQNAWADATPADLLRVGRVHYPDQFARWMAAGFKAAARPFVEVEAWEESSYPRSTRRLGSVEVEGSFHKLLLAAYGQECFYAYEARPGAQGAVTLRVWAFGEHGESVAIGG